MADTYDLEIYKGSTYSLSITLNDSDGLPIDLTNYTVSGLLKNRYGNSTGLANLNPTKIAPYASGIVTLSMSSSVTSALPCSLAFYDIEITASGNTDKVLVGKASIFPEATY